MLCELAYSAVEHALSDGKRNTNLFTSQLQVFEMVVEQINVEFRPSIQIHAHVSEVLRLIQTGKQTLGIAELERIQ